uniref:General secretion pathway protein DN1 n=1 Tax=Malawimonas jakobiformis TaxID=136089 RepID=A0A895KR59_MALJA|nr:general secretion pathway protein DN1 [Malawimonas jakobiformis]
MASAHESDESIEPYYIYLTNSVLDAKLQRYIAAYVEHIAKVLEGPAADASQDPSQAQRVPPNRVVTFMPERNGILLFGFRPSTVRVIYRLLKKLDEETVNLRFEVNLVLVESHRMTSGFEF